MDLGLDEAQQMLRNSARAFLEAECPDSYVREMERDPRGYTPELWQRSRAGSDLSSPKDTAASD